MITKPTIPNDAVDFKDMLAVFTSGSLHVGDGTLNMTEIASYFADKAAMDQFLANHCILLSDLDANPFSIESSVDNFKTLSFTLEKTRNNTVTLRLVGANASRKAWLEDSLNATARTMILINNTKSAALIFSGLRWTCSWAQEADGAFVATISTEFIGSTGDRYIVLPNIPDEA